MDGLRTVRATLERVIGDQQRQFDLLAAPEPAAAPPVSVTHPAQQNDLGAVLSPSQVKSFLDCSARWWFKYGAGFPDPANGSLVRGRVVHRMAEHYFRIVLANKDARGGPTRPDPNDLGDLFQAVWTEEAKNNVVWRNDENPAELKAQAGKLARLYLDQVAHEIDPAAVELSVTGEIGGVPVRGFLDVIDTSGRIIDLKTAGRTPEGIDPGYAFQVATYRQLAPGASGEVRLDTMVATKTPKLVTLAYTVSSADLAMTQHLYPHVREGIREGLFFPNRCSNLCSRKMCNFADACEKEFGGKVKGETEASE
jgi:putative RecB family exonuclease